MPPDCVRHKAPGWGLVQCGYLIVVVDEVATRDPAVSRRVTVERTLTRRRRVLARISSGYLSNLFTAQRCGVVPDCNPYLVHNALLSYCGRIPCGGGYSAKRRDSAPNLQLLDCRRGGRDSSYAQRCRSQAILNLLELCRRRLLTIADWNSRHAAFSPSANPRLTTRGH